MGILDIFGGGGGGDIPDETTQTTITALGPDLKAPANLLFGLGASQLGGVPNQAFGGQLAARPNAFQEAGLSQNLDVATGGQGLGAGSINLGQLTQSGAFLDPTQNPYLQQTINSAINPIADRYSQEILPSILSQIANQGALGNSRNQFPLFKAGNEFIRESGNVASQIALANYQNERQLQQQAPNLIQQGLGLELFPGQQTKQVGDFYQQQEQNLLNEQSTQFNNLINQPFQGLQNFGQLLGLVPGGSSTTSQTNVDQGGGSSGITDAITGGLGGAASGLALNSLLGTAGLSAIPGGNIALPAGLGLLGLLGSIF